MGLFTVVLSLAAVASVALGGAVPVAAPLAAAPLAAYTVPNGLAYSTNGLAYASPYAAYSTQFAGPAVAGPLAYSAFAGPVAAPLAPFGARFASPYVAAPLAARYASPYVAAPVAPLAARIASPYVAAPVARAVAPVAAPLVAAPVATRAAVVAAPIEADSYPQYNFAYSVQDSLTGDSKAQEETREGGVVKGSYSLIEPDGVRRTVNYYADPINGFNAVVQRDVPVAVAAAVKAAPAIVAV